MNKVNDLVYWISERYSMKLRKDAGESVVSPDPAMAYVRYCNVHREDDKVTKWMAEHWRPEHHAVWEIVLARMINYIPSLEDLLNHTSCGPGGYIEQYGRTLKDRRSTGEKVFTSAYTISTCGQRMDKIDYVMGVVEAVKDREPWNWDVPGGASLGYTHRMLMQTNGLGSFLAAQVIADLKNTPGHPLQKAPDWWTWCAPGPGSLRGLEAFYGQRITPSEFDWAIWEAWLEVKPLLPSNIPPIHMQDFQNCLCEFSKYMRVKHGDGRVRNKYPSR